jgi:hypothetical protein
MNLPTDPLRVAQQRGAALLDNTTLVGVEAALREPRTATIADAQSLADVLEALVLHESLAADTWGDSEVYPIDLLHLTERAEGSGEARPIFTRFDRVNSVPKAGVAAGMDDADDADDALTVFTTDLVGDALDRLERGLRPEGGLARQHEQLVECLGVGQSFSTLYREPRPLRQEIVDLLFGDYPPQFDKGNGLPERIQTLEDRIAAGLERAEEDRRLYAMYLLRAFYYEELAAAFSLSYVPHTFRAQALLALRPERGGPPTWMFHMYTGQLAAAVRAAFAEQLELDLTINIPPIASWIARDVDSRGDLLPRALELRASQPARDFRGGVIKQERLLQAESQLTAIKKAKDELKEIVADLGVRLLGNRRVGGHPVNLKLTLGVPGLSAEASTEEVVLRKPLWLKQALRRRRPYLTFFSQLTRDLVSGGVVPFSKRLRQL